MVFKEVWRPANDADFIITSFYTIANGYKEEAKEFVASLGQHKMLKHAQIYEVDGDLTWREAVLLKPQAILETYKHAEVPVMWIDADARILKPFNSMIFADSWDVCWRFRPEANGCPHLSGTILMKPNRDAVRRWLHKWIDLTTEALEPGTPTYHIRGDQEFMNQARHQFDGQDAILGDLDIKYCSIDCIDYNANSGVIYHTQASRRRKR